MDTRDVRTLFAYNRWSNARILDAAARLDDEQFRSPSALPHGGLRGTLVHTLFAEWNHGAQHRSEVAVVLTELGCSPDDLDLIVFLDAHA